MQTGLRVTQANSTEVIRNHSNNTNVPLQAHKEEFEAKDADDSTNNDFLVCAEGYIGTVSVSTHFGGVTAGLIQFYNLDIMPLARYKNYNKQQICKRAFFSHHFPPLAQGIKAT